MSAPPAKLSAYAKRNDTSSVVPLEEDSDSDFNPGAYVPDTPKGSRRQKRSRKFDQLLDSPRPSKRWRNETLSRVSGKCSRRQAETRSPAVPPRQNLLVQYFGDLGIKPAVESEEEREDADDEDEEGSEKNDEDEDNPPPMPRTLAIMYEKAKEKAAADAADDSATEYEEDSEDDSSPSQQTTAKRAATRKPTTAGPSPAKKPRFSHPDESTTEPEDDEPHWVIATPTSGLPRAGGPANKSASGSETEPESDPESISEDIETRPCFPLKQGQSCAEPLALDKAHKVPGSINTFLREYQRVGVRFFWERYKEDRGGLLGDDMGLERLYKLYRSSPPSCRSEVTAWT
ncbi:hypothetical protein BC628DRAFT_977838 [Trametes gibbosa]|nr:hypothetical protein BC628DRAFT_977838 [Trametes gibbosa]